MNIDDVIAIFTPAEGYALDRLEICARCTDYNPKSKKCGVCGCIMPLKAKMPNERCPIRKWGPVDES